MGDTLETWVEVVRGLLVEVGDDAMPLQRGLAAHRAVQTRKVKKMTDVATDVRDLAYENADILAKEKIVLAELTDAATDRRKLFPSLEEAKKDKEFSRLCDEIAESKINIADMEADVADSFKDSEDAIKLINEQSDNLARVARMHGKMVRREKMITLREQQQAAKEEILKIFPDDQSNYVQRQSDKLDKRERRLKSRADVTNAVWNHQHPAGAKEEVSDGAQSVMDEIEKSLSK